MAGFLARVNQYVRGSARPEKFAQTWSVGDPAFAAWLFGTEDGAEIVTPYTVLGLSAVLRSTSVISTTIAGLPLRTYERSGDDRARVPSVFDDPYPGLDGMPPFAWCETILLHELLWRRAFLWHEAFDGNGEVSAYRPILPDTVTKVERVNGRKRFTYRTVNGTDDTVGTEQITHIPGPSFDGVDGHPLLYAARSIFSGAISGDKAASRTMRMGIRLGGILGPAEGEDISVDEGEELVKALRTTMVGRENAGDLAWLSKRIDLKQWSPTNTDSQWHEARLMAIDEVGRIFGVPPHLLNAIEKQTSWGTGVAEQNLGFALFTLMGWSKRVEQHLSLRLPEGQFCEFEYKGLLQGTPEKEVRLVMEELAAGLITLDYACRILNLPAPTPDQQAAVVAQTRPTPVPPTPIRQEATA